MGKCCAKKINCLMDIVLAVKFDQLLATMQQSAAVAVPCVSSNGLKIMH
jgi:hypothetical protein